VGLHQQKDTLEVRGGSGIDVPGHFPEDVGGHPAAGEGDLRAAARDNVLTDVLKMNTSETVPSMVMPPGAVKCTSLPHSYTPAEKYGR